MKCSVEGRWDGFSLVELETGGLHVVDLELKVWELVGSCNVFEKRFCG